MMSAIERIAAASSSSSSSSSGGESECDSSDSGNETDSDELEVSFGTRSQQLDLASDPATQTQVKVESLEPTDAFSEDNLQSLLAAAEEAEDEEEGDEDGAEERAGYDEEAEANARSKHQKHSRNRSGSSIKAVPDTSDRLLTSSGNKCPERSTAAPVAANEGESDGEADADDLAGLIAAAEEEGGENNDDDDDDDEEDDDEENLALLIAAAEEDDDGDDGGDGRSAGNNETDTPKSHEDEENLALLIAAAEEDDDDGDDGGDGRSAGNANESDTPKGQAARFLSASGKSRKDVSLEATLLLRQKGPALKVESESGPAVQAVHASAARDRDAPAALDEYSETFSRLRIADAEVKKSIVDVQMKGRKFLHLHDIPRVPVADFQRDSGSEWVIIAVLDKKSPVKLTKKGDRYSMWTLTDLREVSINVLLFREAHASHWKDPIGSVMVLLNPQALPAIEKTGRLLTADKPNQLIRLGRAADLKRCPAQWRKGTRGAGSGTTCNRAIHKSKSMCSEHLARQVQKAQVHRGMLQATAQSRANNIFDKHAAARKNLSAGNFQFSRSGFGNVKNKSIYLSHDKSAASNVPISRKAISKQRRESEQQRLARAKQRSEAWQAQQGTTSLSLNISESGHATSIMKSKQLNRAKVDDLLAHSRGNGSRMLGKARKATGGVGSVSQPSAVYTKKRKTSGQSNAIAQRSQMRRDAIATKQAAVGGGKLKRKRLVDPKADMLAAAVQGTEPSRSAASRTFPPPVSSSVKKSTRTARQNQHSRSAQSLQKHDQARRRQSKARSASAMPPDLKSILAENDRLRAQLKRIEERAQRKRSERIKRTQRPASAEPRLAVLPSFSGTSSKPNDCAAIYSSERRNNQLSSREQALRRAEEARLRDPQYLLMKKLLKDNKAEIQFDPNKWEAPAVPSERPAKSKADVQPVRSDASQQLAAAFGGKLVGKTARSEKELLAAKSQFDATPSHSQQVRMAMIDEERLHAKQRETTSTKAKIHMCTKCKLHHRSASNVCSERGHPVVVRTMTVHFSRCKGCKRRCESYDRVHPAKCIHCGGGIFVTVGMRNEMEMAKKIQAWDRRSMFLGARAAGGW